MCQIRLKRFLSEVRACQLCVNHLPFEPKPILRASCHAKILVAAQAPGKRAHDTGMPFNDPSGDRLRDWMGVDKETFYDDGRIAIVPMGFCFPGKGKSGDLPPRRECADAWREKLLSLLPNIQFTLVLGQYAYKYHLPDSNVTLTETVKDWHAGWPQTMLLPHPSPRNNIWLKKNPWFEARILPKLKTRVAEVLRS